MNVRYRVALSQAEREELDSMVKGGRHAARRINRAQVLWAADAGRSDEVIAGTIRVSGSTVYRTKQRFVTGNLDSSGRDIVCFFSVPIRRYRRFSFAAVESGPATVTEIVDGGGLLDESVFNAIVVSVV